jgi:hypothetical protein
MTQRTHRSNVFPGPGPWSSEVSLSSRRRSCVDYLISELGLEKVKVETWELTKSFQNIAIIEARQNWCYGSWVGGTPGKGLAHGGSGDESCFETFRRPSPVLQELGDTSSLFHICHCGIVNVKIIGGGEASAAVTKPVPCSYHSWPGCNPSVLSIDWCLCR